METEIIANMKKIQKITVKFKLRPLWAVVFTVFSFVLLVSPAKAQQIRIGSGVHFVNGTNVIVNGDSIVNKGTLKNKATGVIKLTGNWQNHGTCSNEKGSVVTLAGSTGQVIGGSNATTFGTLNLNNSAGFSLATNTRVNGKLDFQNGMLATGSNLLTIGDTGTIANASAAKYVNGKLAIAFSSLGTKPFPIGKGGNYRPVTLQFTGLTGTSTVTAEQFETGLSGTLPENTTMLTTGRHWTINQAGGSNMQYFVKLDATDYTPSRPVLMVKQDAGTMVSGATTTPDYTNSTAFGTFSEFGLGEACIIPTSGGTLSSDQAGCESLDPAEITGTLPSGNVGIIEYKWQLSTTSDISSFTDIASANSNNYNPGTVTQTTWFKRLARVSCKDDWTGAAESNVVEVAIEYQAILGTLSKTPDITYICQGDDVSSSLTAGSGGNGTDELEYRTKTGASSWSGWTAYTTGTNISSAGKTGIEVRTRRMASYCSNSDYTTVSWIVDLTNPLAVAKVSGSVTLDPTGNYTLTTADVLSSYSDAGVGVETVSMVPASVSCANLGLITVTVTVTDYCGNQTVVAPQLIVIQGTALLPPWVQGNTSPSANGTAVYSPCTNNGTFYLTTQGVSAPKVDVHDFVYQQLCGNGTVIVRLDDVQNGGWAGVMMRESNAPGAKAVYIKTRLYNPSVYIGYRTTTNGNMTNVSQTIPLIHWMKIQRSGNSFMIYTSYNGTSWIRRYTATVAMTSCVNAGFFAENIVSGRTTKAWFDHAEVVGYLKDSDEEFTEINDPNLFEVMVYPNPANDRITISIPDNNEKVKVTLINASGLVVERSEFNTMDAEYPISHIKPGLYLLKFERNGMIVNKRLVVL
jgi:hypothetical protein